MTPDTVEVLLRSRRFEVQRWCFEGTAVGRIERDIVVHPGAVVILPLLTDADVVMIRQVRVAVGGELLELPAGTLEPGEAPRQAAERELEEETGYRAAVLQPLCQFYTTPGICTERTWAFVARDLRPTAPRRDATEQIRTEIMDLQDLWRSIAAGTLEDGKTIATLATYWMQRG